MCVKPTGPKQRLPDRKSKVTVREVALVADRVTSLAREPRFQVGEKERRLK